MSFSDVLERILLDSVLGNGTPATYQFGLSSSAPTDSGTLNEISLINGYARKTINNNATSFPAAFTGLDGKTHKRMATTFTWTATGSWGSVTHWFLWDTTNNRLVIWGPLTVQMPQTTNGDVVRLNGGSMDIALD